MLYRIAMERFSESSSDYWPIRHKDTVYACFYNGMQAWTKEGYATFGTYAIAKAEMQDRYSQGHIFAGNLVKIERI